MVRSMLICGLLAGLLAGVLAFGFDKVAGEPAVDQAIAFESAHEPAAEAAHAESPLVSRHTQKGVGLLTATVVYGLAVGGIFALVFAVAYGRVSRAGPARTALLLALASFLVLYLVPFLKYPGNPPAVGHEDTIGERTALYLTMVWISICAAVAAWRVRATLKERLAPEAATLAGLATYGVTVAVAGLALPGKHEVPGDFPATTLWRFREASIGSQMVIWTTVGLVFAFLAQRVMTGRSLRALLPRIRMYEPAGAIEEDDRVRSF